MNTATPCPQKDKLVDYLLGKLPVVEQESCELHIVDCTSCEDTIRNLKVTDTLDRVKCGNSSLGPQRWTQRHAKLDQDQETGTIFLLADDAQHKKVRDLIKTLDDSE